MSSTSAAGSDELTQAELLQHYRVMRTIREFEERVHREFATGDIPGFVHLYAGEEAIAAGVCACLREDDYITSTHRGHGHAIAKGCDVIGMMAEIFGRRTGLSKGKGGSMHIADFGLGMLGANGIVAGGSPLICGVGLSAKIRGTDQVGVTFAGDGASNQGMFLESLNLASIWNANCIFVVENNGYAEATASTYHQGGIDVAKRADGFGMPGVVVDGSDFFAVHEAAGEAISRARAGGGPTLLECKTVRFFGHFEGDAQTYRGENEVENARVQRDPLTRFEEQATAAGLVSEEALRAIDDEVAALIDEAVEQARAAPEPQAADLLTDVYINY
jgi:acetoin:2,6-dichlorophenolindophenol oxidoreductase subunit alpha